MDKKPNLPALSKVREALKADWALRVKQRDGWKCLLCGGTELLTAHHWYVTSQRGHAARYSVDNGASLCFTCHIREVHENPGWATINKIRRAVIANSPNYNETLIDQLTCIDIGVAELRTLWNEMRLRPVLPPNFSAVEERGKKLYLKTEGRRPIAVVGNTVFINSFGVCEVLVVAQQDDGYRYTIGRL